MTTLVCLLHRSFPSTDSAGAHNLLCRREIHSHSLTECRKERRDLNSAPSLLRSGVKTLLVLKPLTTGERIEGQTSIIENDLANKVVILRQPVELVASGLGKERDIKVSCHARSSGLFPLSSRNNDE